MRRGSAPPSSGGYSIGDLVEIKSGNGTTNRARIIEYDPGKGHCVGYTDSAGNQVEKWVKLAPLPAPAQGIRLIKEETGMRHHTDMVDKDRMVGDMGMHKRKLCPCRNGAPLPKLGAGTRERQIEHRGDGAVTTGTSRQSEMMATENGTIRTETTLRDAQERGSGNTDFGEVRVGGGQQECQELGWDHGDVGGDGDTMTERSFISATSKGGRKKVRHVASRYLQQKTPTKPSNQSPTAIPPITPKSARTPTKSHAKSPSSSRTPGRPAGLVAARIAAGMVPGPTGAHSSTVPPPSVARHGTRLPPPSVARVPKKSPEIRSRALLTAGGGMAGNQNRDPTLPGVKGLLPSTLPILHPNQTTTTSNVTKLPDDVLLLRRSRLLQWKYLNARSRHASNLRRQHARQQIGEAYEVARAAQDRVAGKKVEVEQEMRRTWAADALEEQHRAFTTLKPTIDSVRPAYTELARALRVGAVRMPVEGVIVSSRDELVRELEKCSQLLESINLVATDRPDGTSSVVAAVPPTRAFAGTLVQTLSLLSASAEIIHDMERSVAVAGSVRIGEVQVGEVAVEGIVRAMGGGRTLGGTG
ncbi:hypothetical protein HDU93_009449 [Gonapodya sp. JEL0774]|nr:hypothetical protein HDU93_009449 [Gonapodya sp. JEL0774]